MTVALSSQYESHDVTQPFSPQAGREMFLSAYGGEENEIRLPTVFHIAPEIYRAGRLYIVDLT